MPTIPGEQRPIPTDARLVWMASERAAPLFRTLDRAQAFDPLIVLFCVVPAIVVAFAATCSAWDAAVALLALDGIGIALPAQLHSAVREMVPEGSVEPTALWLTAATLRGGGLHWPMGVVLASLLGGIALMAMMWGFSNAFSGRRLAFWTVVLTAFHPTLMALSVCPVPVSVGLAGTVAALWGHARLTERGYWAIGKVVWVGVAIALSLLVAGPIALAGVLVLVIDTVLSWLFRPSPEVGQRNARTQQPPWRLLGLRALALGLGFFLYWIGGMWIPEHYLSLETPDQPLIEEVPLELGLPTMQIGPLWGIMAIGIGRLVRLTQRRTGQRSGRYQPRLLLTWVLVSVAMLFWFPQSPDAAFDAKARFVLANASVPLLIAAAFAIEEAARRAVSGAWMILAFLLPLLMRVGDLMAFLPYDLPMVWLGALIVIPVAVWLVLLLMRALIPAGARGRTLLISTMLIVMAVDASDGIRLVFEEELSSNEVQRLADQLREEEPSDGVVILTQEETPLTLVYALRMVYQDVPLKIAPNWDEAVGRMRRDTEQMWHRPLVAGWGQGTSLAAASPDVLRPIGEPLMFQGRALLMYVADRPTVSSAGIEVTVSPPGADPW